MTYPLILTVTSDGNPHSWINYEAAIVLKYKGLLAYEFGSDESLFRGGISRMTGERSQITVSSMVALKGKYKTNNKTPALTNPNLFARDLHTCSYCGRFTPEERLTRDHIVPVSKGGKDIWQNVVACCKKCNNHKGNKSLQEADMELLWVPYVPVRAEQLIMSNRRILADQAEFILGFVPKHSRMHQFVERKFSYE